MQLMTAVILINALAWISTAKAHHAGQEFTYLSMFQKPGSEQGFTERERVALSSQYLKTYSLTGDVRRQRLRKLQSERHSQERKEVMDADNEDGSNPSESDNDDNLLMKEQAVRAGDDSMETEKTEKEDVLGDTNSEEVEVSSGDNDDDASEENLRGSTTESPKIKALRKVVRVADSDSLDEEEEEESPKLNKRDAKETKTSSAKNKRKPEKENSRGSSSKEEEDVDSEDATMPDMMEEGHKNGEDIKRLTMMLMKIIKQYKVKSLVDVPCRAHSHWMPMFLRQVGKLKLKKPFKYYCVDTNREILRILRARVSSEVNAKFVLKRFWKDTLPSADLVFSWSGLDNMKEENVLKYLERLSVSKNKFVLVGSHSGELESEGSGEMISRFTLGGKPVNLRREPFNLAKPMRIVGDLSTGGNDKQLYLYKPKEMIRAE